MGTKRIGQEQQRTIVQNSTGAYSVTLPVGLVRELGWRKGQKVVIKRHGKKLAVEDWQ